MKTAISESTTGWEAGWRVQEGPEGGQMRVVDTCCQSSARNRVV